MKYLVFACLTVVCVLTFASIPQAQQTKRALRFKATTPDEARQWQEKARQKLFALLMGGKKPGAVPFNVRILKHEEPIGANYTLDELSLQTLPDRRVHCWLATPKSATPGATPAMLGLPGHSGTGEQVVRGQGLYWYGKAFAERGYLIVAPDIGSHDLQHKNWTLMGERTWDALVCLNFLCSLPSVDKNRVGVAGLSLGGETTMYVAALDERIKVAVSSGWLTTVANVKDGH
jgi:cephalosporin-C deacetylase-like acetyl esterase